jgi:DnaK suppressor protein
VDDGEQLRTPGRHGRPGERQQTDAKILQAIEEALQRVEEGTFGLCRDCGQPIADARLNAIPWTRVCISCKEKQKA